MKQITLYFATVLIFMITVLVSCEPSRKSEGRSIPMATDSTINAGASAIPDSAQRN